MIKIQFQFVREIRSATIQIDDEFTFDYLIQLVSQSFPKCKHPFTSFDYVDDDGDRITVSSELEMEPLRAFYSRLCDQETADKVVLQLQPIANRNRANLTIDPVQLNVDEEQSKKSFTTLNANVEHMLCAGTMLTLDMLEIIGTGNGGIVRRCRNRSTKEILAVKIISLDFEKEEKKHQIVMELNALNILNSDYIVQLHGAYLHENAVHICTEYMDRGSLEQYIGLFVPEQVLLQITLAMIQGLMFMWSRKIMHRDVKPSNVLVNSSGSIKLCDFGVSRVLETIGQKILTFIGTHKYMAPERILSDQYSIPSEIWSLGMTILEIGLGKYPFQSDNSHSTIATRPIELVHYILYETPMSLPVDRDYSSEFATLIQQCLEKNPVKRPSPTVFLENSLLIKSNREDQSRLIIAEFFNGPALNYKKS